MKGKDISASHFCGCQIVGVLYPPCNSCTGSRATGPSFYLPTTVYFVLSVFSSHLQPPWHCLAGKPTASADGELPPPSSHDGVTFPKVTLANPHAPQLSL